MRLANKINLITLVLASSFLLSVSANSLPFNDDMVNSQLRAGSVMRPSVKGTIAVGTKESFLESKEEAEAMVNPKKATKESIQIGKRLFAVNCSACHGKLSPDPKKYVAGRVVMGAPNLADKTYHSRTDGQIFRAIYFGNLIMPALGWKMSHDEAWDIINYVRSVQNTSKEFIEKESK